MIYAQIMQLLIGQKVYEIYLGEAFTDTRYSLGYS